MSECTDVDTTPCLTGSTMPTTSRRSASFSEMNISLYVIAWAVRRWMAITSRLGPGTFARLSEKANRPHGRHFCPTTLLTRPTTWQPSHPRRKREIGWVPLYRQGMDPTRQRVSTLMATRHGAWAVLLSVHPPCRGSSCPSPGRCPVPRQEEASWSPARRLCGLGCIT